MTNLVAQDVSVQAAGETIVRNASVALAQGELVAILGPNGAGKTTLLRAMLGLAKIANGSVRLGDKDCHAMSPRERAKQVSYLPQQRPLAWPTRVRDIVALGRFAHGAALGRLSSIDAAAVGDAISACDLGALAERSTDSLSGGELARVHFARTIAAKSPLLVADEPVAELDPRHQLLIADLIRQFTSRGGGALVVLHEVALAARIADRLIWMKNGSIVADGPPRQTLTSETMEKVYGVVAHVTEDSHGVDVRVQSAL